jgi:spermidine synthase
MPYPHFHEPATADAPTTSRRGIVALYVITVFCGLAGLGYEIVWTRMLSVALGHEILSVLAVLAAFFSGLALGAIIFDRLIGTSLVPGRWYALLEFVVGGWALALCDIIPWANEHVPALLGVDPGPLRQWATAFLVPVLLLLPATVAMGGTLPALERLLSRSRQDGWSVGGVYAANTLGAVAGTLLAAFVFVPAFGFAATLKVLAAVNVACALAVLIGPARHERQLPPVATVADDDRPNDRRLLLTLFATGLLGIGYEVLVIRVLSQVMENTVYSFASILSVYLLGTAAGAALYQAYGKPGRFAPTLDLLLALLATLCLAGTAVLWSADSMLAGLHAALGRSIAAAISAEMFVAFAVFLLPAVGMGALFSHLAQGMRRRDGGFGAALAVNMAGASATPLVMGVLVLPAIGAKASLVACATGYLTLMPTAKRFALMAAGVPVLLAGGLLLFTGPLQFVQIPPGGALVDHADGTMAAVSVIADARGDRHLQVNAHFRMGGTASVRSDHRQAHIPLLLHDDPHRALFLGLGTGATIAAAAEHPGLESDGVELVPEIVPTLRHFARANGDLSALPQLHLRVADARRFVRATDRRYDVIVADLFHPWIDGAGFLYTREHFQAVRDRLNPGGLFCQWLPLHQLDLPTLRLIVRTFGSVFPDAQVYLATFSLETPIIALIGGVPPSRRYPADWYDERVRDAALRRRLEAVGLRDGFALFGLYLAGGDELARFAGRGSLNTDDRPLVLFRAPLAAYAPAEPPSVRLVTLLEQLRPRPEDLLAAPGGDSGSGTLTASRLEAYWAARRAFIQAGLRADPSADVQTFARKTAPDLLDVVRISPDFEPASAPVVAIARRLASVDPAGAQGLLAELRAAIGDRGELRR